MATATATSGITRSMTVGVFKTRAQAQQVIADLKKLGISDDKIGLIAKNEHGDGHSGLENDPTHSRWEEGSGIGAAAGAATGTGLGLAVAAGFMTPVGPLIAGGALVALLASAGAGATIGTLLGGLIGLGISEEDAAFYETEIHSGSYLVTVEAGGRASEVQAVFHRYEGYDRTTSPAATVTNRAVGATGATTARAPTHTTATGDQTVRLHEEQLKANK